MSDTEKNIQVEFTFIFSFASNPNFKIKGKFKNSAASQPLATNPINGKHHF